MFNCDVHFGNVCSYCSVVIMQCQSNLSLGVKILLFIKDHNGNKFCLNFIVLSLTNECIFTIMLSNKSNKIKKQKNKNQSNQ